MRVLVTIALFALTVRGTADAQVVIDTEAIDAAVETQMAEQKIVGVAIGVIRNGKVVYTKGYGQANIADSIAVDRKTVFNWASNSKPVMAVAALQLAEDDLLDIDESIQTYLPDLPDSLRDVTTRHLLCHQSGIPHYSNGEIVPASVVAPIDEQTDPAKAITRFIKSPLLFAPGADEEYSSHAYVLLSAVVQAAGSQKIDKQLADRIADPLQLTSFQLDLPFDDQPNWTIAYRLSPEGVHEPIVDTAHFWKHGAGGYKSNVRDFAAWAVALMNSKLLEAESTKAMWTPQQTSDDQATTRGLGVVVTGSDESLKISHGGRQDETRTRMVLYPNQKHGIVVMCNMRAADAGKITTAIYSAMNN